MKLEVQTLRNLFYKGVLLTIPSLLWAGNHLLARYLRRDFHPYDLAFFRWSLALTIVWVLYGKLTVLNLSKLWDAKWLVLILGATGVAGYNTFVYYGLETTTALNASFINSIIPLLIILMSLIFLKVIPHGIEWVCMALSIFGVLIIVSKGDIKILQTLDFNVGDLLIMSAALTWAIYSIWVSRLLKRVPPQVLLCAIVTAGWFMLVPYFGYRVVKTLTSGANNPIQSLKPSGMLFIIYVAVFATILAYRIWNKCVETMGANLSGLALNLLPLFTALGAVLFLGETFHLYHFWGGITIMLSLIVVFYLKQKTSLE